MYSFKLSLPIISKTPAKMIAVLADRQKVLRPKSSISKSVMSNSVTLIVAIFLYLLHSFSSNILSFEGAGANKAIAILKTIDKTNIVTVTGREFFETKINDIESRIDKVDIKKHLISVFA